MLPPDVAARVTVEATRAAFFVGLPALALFVATVRRRSLLEQAKRSRDAGHGEGPLRPGASTIIHGVVEPTPADEAAIEITITQEGHERGPKDALTHSWREVRREARAVPFVVADRRGFRVRVEANDQTRLVDALDEVTYEPNGNVRRRRARLVAGEPIYVLGELAEEAVGGAYRGQDAALVMRAPKRGALVCSTRPLDERFLRDATRHGRFAWFFGAVALLLLAFEIPPMLALLRASPDTVTVIGTRMKPGPNTNCYVDVRASHGDALTLRMPSSACKTRKAGDTFTHLRPIESAWPFLSLPTFAIMLLGLITFAVGRRRPWYEAAVIDVGVGPLARPAKAGHELDAFSQNADANGS